LITENVALATNTVSYGFPKSESLLSLTAKQSPSHSKNLHGWLRPKPQSPKIEPAILRIFSRAQDAAAAMMPQQSASTPGE